MDKWIRVNRNDVGSAIPDNPGYVARQQGDVRPVMSIRSWARTDPTVTHYMIVPLPDPPKAEVQYVCPFCGGQELRPHQIMTDMWRVRCLSCDATGPMTTTEAAAMAHFRKEG